MIVEHIFSLANFSNIRDEVLFPKIKEVLSSRYRNLAKLSCLDYMLYHRDCIDETDYALWNNLGFVHTRDDLVRFQSCVDLSVYEQFREWSLIKVKGILRRTRYPTLFYRLVNQLELLPADCWREVVVLVKRELQLKDFSFGVIGDIRSRLREK